MVLGRRHGALGAQGSCPTIEGGDGRRGAYPEQKDAPAPSIDGRRSCVPATYMACSALSPDKKDSWVQGACRALAFPSEARTSQRLIAIQAGVISWLPSKVTEQSITCVEREQQLPSQALKACPLSQKTCGGQKCAWWSTTFHQCVLLVISDALLQLPAGK